MKISIKKSEVVIFALVFVSFIIGVLFYGKMPQRMVTHWDLDGQPNGYMSRFWGIFMFPLMLAGLGLLFVAIPRIDPLKENIRKFRKYYDGFVILFFTFMLAVHVFVILWNIGYKISANVIIGAGLTLLFFYSGILLENAKRNWFIGIRTPWTLSSERVWDKTHRIGGKLFKIVALIILIGSFTGRYVLLFIFISLVAITSYLVVYSYVEFQKEQREM